MAATPFCFWFLIKWQLSSGIWTLMLLWSIATPSLSCHAQSFLYVLFFILCVCECSFVSWPPRWPSGKASTSRAEDPGFESRLRRDFFGVESYQWLKNWHSSGYPGTLPGAWRYRVSTGTGRPGVSILWLGEVESLVYNFYLSVAARAIVWADPSLRYTRMLLGR